MFSNMRIGLGIGIDSVSGGGIPFKSDALFWLDGTLNGTGTALVDKINGWEFPLSAAYDWGTHLKIIPYKTLLTIKAPASPSDAATAIKLDDPKNFWYAGTAVANRPVHFSNGNIDYNYQTFAKICNRVVDANGVEIKPAGITDIVLYKTPKTGADLAKCNAYFNVPTENPSALWVNPISGNDTTGTGTKANPYKKITKATTIGANNTIYVTTGRCDEGNNLNIQNPCTIIGLSNCPIYNTVATNVVNISHTTADSVHIIKNITMGTVNQSVDIITDNNGLSNLAITIDCCFASQYQKKVYSSIAVGCDAKITNCVFNSTRVSEDATGFTVNTIDYVNVISDFSGNYIEDRAYNGFTGNIPVFKYNKIVHLAVAKNIAASYIINGAIAVDCRFNEWISSLSQYTVARNLIGITGASSILISYNKLIVNSEYATSGINIFGSAGATITGSCHIHNNYIKNLGRNVYSIKVGTEVTTSGDNKINDIVIEKNTILGHQFIDTSKVGTSHALMVGFQLDAIIRYNYVYRSRINIIVKGNTTTAWTGGGVYGNVSIDSDGELIFIKGVSGVKIYNNTFLNTLATNDASDTMLVRFGGLDESLSLPNNCILKNNIIIDRSPTVGFTDLIAILSGTTGIISNNNILFSVNGNYGAGVGTFAEWQAIGFDTNSQNINPTFYDTVNHKFYLTTPIYGGANLGTDFDDLLDIYTVFVNGTNLPTVISKLQGNNWNIGAYAH